ncbi:TetR/AcrR family transcriptional regulator [Alkalihalobacillus sp. AL-G]|uniref:TetR/AcrR family transcriptional regulator n=1 Tax=Alkalihalobacillus sp. AL-G TaxID=2926399 RepID=UPI00272CF688|nr:TetR/AcrR family transcriptional regulator [Alkalihalobacillus sp. AL-G]WLD91941.1 TetR/AcrR family transcriptional regulator [Alkalihalobacillus sp. AL-G]
MPKVSKKYKEEKRSAILEAATQCFAQKGYNETTVDDIANASGTSKGSIYLYFSSKEEIFFRLNEERTERFFAIKKELDMKKSATEKIHYLFEYFLSGKLEEGDLERISVSFEFWIYISKHPDKQKLFDERANMFTDFMKEIVKEGIDAGEFSPDVSIQELSYMFWALTDGILLHLLFHKQEKKHKAMLRTLEYMVLAYLKTGNRFSLETE